MYSASCMKPRQCLSAGILRAVWWSSGRPLFSSFAGDCCLWWQKRWLYLVPPSSTTQNTSFNELQHLSVQAFHSLLNRLHRFFFFLISNFKQIFLCRNVGKSLLSARNGLSGSQMLGSHPPSFSPPVLSGVSLSSPEWRSKSSLFRSSS